MLSKTANRISSCSMLCCLQDQLKIGLLCKEKQAFTRLLNGKSSLPLSYCPSDVLSWSSPPLRSNGKTGMLTLHEVPCSERASRPHDFGVRRFDVIPRFGCGCRDRSQPRSSIAQSESKDDDSLGPTGEWSKKQLAGKSVLDDGKFPTGLDST